MARKAQKPAGDMTGRKSDELAKQHAEELAKRQGEIALMNQQAAEESDEIHDLTGNGPMTVTRHPDQEGVTTSTDDDGIMTVTVPGGREAYTIKTNDTVLQGVGPEGPSNVPGETVGGQRQRGIVDKTELNDPQGDRGVDGEVRSMGVAVAEAPTKVIRVNTTLEDVTIGQGNLYSFKEGEKYRVPSHVADHLEEKGLVWH